MLSRWAIGGGALRALAGPVAGLPADVACPVPGPSPWWGTWWGTALGAAIAPLGGLVLPLQAALAAPRCGSIL